MQLTKHHGLGNDFLVVLEEVNGPLHGDATLARALCDRRRGLGADGFVIGARPAPGQTAPDGRAVDLVMHLWNADGSRAEMSGNGIRCLGQALAGARDDHEATYVVATDGGIRTLVVHDDADHRLAQVHVTMGPVGVGPDIPAAVSERLADSRHATADMGNPHLVVLVPDLHGVDLVGTGSWLESQFPNGVNVEFITPGAEPDSLELLVWERGAGVTEACGTGATAAAHLAHRWDLVGREVRVVMPGGSAEVVLAPDDSPGDEPVLIGPSQHVATVEVPDAERPDDDGLDPLDADDLVGAPGFQDGYDEYVFDPDGDLDHLDEVEARPVESHRGAFGDFGGESSGLIDRTFREKIVLVGVTPQGDDDEDTARHLDELALLVDTAGADAVARVEQRRQAPDPATYLGSGKVAELKELCEAVDADTVVFDDELSPAQQRNLEKLLGRTAIDRTAVILDIFGQNAHSLEGKAQVELAQIRYRLPRLRGKGKSLSQQRGGIGARQGGGETQLEVDRRKLLRRMHKLEADLRDIQRVRTTQAKARQRSRLHRVAIVGYTNAGKSTLLNRLTDAGVLVEDRLFATLDATTRRLQLPGGETVLVTDTVGFITKLPTQLVEAFKSTLEVVVDADLLVHVVDASAPDPEENIFAVDQVLQEIGAGAVPQLLVANKLDAGPEGAKRLLVDHAGSVAISARTGEGVDDLLRTIGDRLRGLSVITELVVPFDRGDVLASLHREGEVLVETATDDGMRVRARLDDASVSRLREFVVAGSPGPA